MNDRQKKKDILKQIKEMTPNLTKDKEALIKEIMDLDDDSQDHNEEIVLDRITYNNTVYYRDTGGGVWDSKAELVGVINNNELSLFADLKKETTHKTPPKMK